MYGVIIIFIIKHTLFKKIRAYDNMHITPSKTALYIIYELRILIFNTNINYTYTYTVNITL